MTTARQLVLDLSSRPALSREDFFVSPANAAAVALVDQWPHWPAHVAVIVGQPGSGKSHLVEVWRQASGAGRMDAAALSAAAVPAALVSGALALEDVDRAPLDQTALFHALNLAREQGGHVLLTAVRHPELWDISLNDLATRLKLAPVVEIAPPDDALLRAVLVKHFADRQIAVDEGLIAYLLTRMPRSMASARALVAEIDRRALEERAEISRPFAARVLVSFASPDLFPEP